MSYIQFVGSKKTGQTHYRGGSILCRLDTPATCKLEVGVDVSLVEAGRLLQDHGDVFKSEAQLASKRKTPKRRVRKPAKASTRVKGAVVRAAAKKPTAGKAGGK